MSGRDERDVERNEIALREERIELQAARSALFDLPGGQARIVCADFHAERAGDARNALADLSEADETQCFSLELAPRVTRLPPHFFFLELL